MQRHASIAEVYRRMAEMLERIETDLDAPPFLSGGPYALMSHQMEIVSAVHDFRVFVQGPRQSGISVAAAASAVLYAMSYPKQKVHLSTFDYNGGQQLCRIIREELLDLPDRVKGGLESVGAFYFKNDSTLVVHAHSAMPRGAAPSLIVVDRAEMLREDTLSEMRSSPARLMLLTSEPHRMPPYLEELSKDRNWTRITLAGSYRVPYGGPNLYVTSHIKPVRHMDELRYVTMCRECGAMSPGISPHELVRDTLKDFGWVQVGIGLFTCPECWSKKNWLQRILAKIF